LPEENYRLKLLLHANFKLEAIFGKRWGRFEEAYTILYGGIDSITVTERNAQPSYEPRETYFCGGREDFHVDDPHTQSERGAEL